MPKNIKVLFLAAEAAPFVKIGGLADVAGSLPRALQSLSEEETNGIKLDIRLAIPLHMVIRSEAATLRPVANFSLARSGNEVNAQVFETRLEHLPVYFIAGDPINTSGSVYSANAAQDGEKYTFFSIAALEMTKHLDWTPDIIHVNDWHAALASYALLLKRWDGGMTETKSVLTVHNLPFSGPDVTGRLATYGLPLVSTDLPEWAHALPLPLGIWAADKIVAVSPSYADEMLTAEQGAGLEKFLAQRKDHLTGILNGIDTKSFDPANDEALEANFTIDSLDERAWNKIALQQELGLAVDSDTPLFGIVSRMDTQKGIDLVFEALQKTKNDAWQAVILGTGDPRLESKAERLQSQLPDKVKVITRYDAQLARRIYGGADIFLMPSRYEPCGLSQMIAMRYGCVPIVRSTGGLKDTVKHCETGFVFEDAKLKDFRKAISEALTVYSDRERWQQLQRNGMAQDFSWANSAKKYVELYETLLNTPSTN